MSNLDVEKEISFLQTLAERKPYHLVRQELNFATDIQLRVLVYILNSLIHGKFPISARNFEQIEANGKVRALHTAFESKDELKEVLKLPNWREIILKKLYTISIAFPFLLQRVVTQFSSEKTGGEEETVEK